MLDPDIRSALVPLLVPEQGTGRLLGEVGIWGNSVRIDLARLTPTAFDGFEIKSAGDTLARIGRQAEIYGHVCNTLTIIAADRHLAKAETVLPTWWGMIRATPSGAGVELSQVRPAENNPDPDAERIAGLLWKDEALSILKSLGVTRGLSKMRVGDAYKALSTTLELAPLRQLVFGALLARERWLDSHDPSFVGPRRPRF